jgi:hypothetical protein
VKSVTPTQHPIVTALLVLGVYGATFVGATVALGVPEASAALARAIRR